MTKPSKNTSKSSPSDKKRECSNSSNVIVWERTKEIEKSAKRAINNSYAPYMNDYRTNCGDGGDSFGF